MQLVVAKLGSAARRRAARRRIDPRYIRCSLARLAHFVRRSSSVAASHMARGGVLSGGVLSGGVLSGGVLSGGVLFDVCEVERSGTGANLRSFRLCIELCIERNKPGRGALTWAGRCSWMVSVHEGRHSPSNCICSEVAPATPCKCHKYLQAAGHLLLCLNAMRALDLSLVGEVHGVADGDPAVDAPLASQPRSSPSPLGAIEPEAQLSLLDGEVSQHTCQVPPTQAYGSEWMLNGEGGYGVECGQALPWSLPEPVQEQLPLAIQQAGDAACYAYVEFFAATVRNPNTRRAYANAIKQFLHWCEAHRLPLRSLNSVLVSSYIEHLAGSPPKRKQHLAAIRHFFDHLVLRHVLGFNPASSVRGPRYSVRKGKTPVLAGDEARHLLNSIGTSHILGVRDRALIGLMVYTFARIGAVVTMNRCDYYPVGKRWWVRLHEKGGKEHQVPVHHEAEELLDAYLEASGSLLLPPPTPLFRTLRGRTQVLSPNRLSANDALCMIKRRAREAGLPTSIGCHTFRATGITAYLHNGGTLEKAQQIASHASPQTTKLYDRTGDDITFDEIQRIRLG